MRIPLSPLEIRRRALRAAAAAAGLSALSCSTLPGTQGAVPDVNAGGSDGSVAADAGPDSAAGDVAAADSGNSDSAAGDVAAADSGNGDSAATDAAATDSAVTDIAANDSIDDIIDTAGLADADTAGCAPLGQDEPDCKAKLNTPEWAQCCDDHNAWCAAAHPDNTEAAQACQFGADFSGNCTGCIPWGPPAPPAFDPAWQPRVLANGPVFEVV